MTVTKEMSLLHSFKMKIDEAASYVPKMSAADKVKAIQFWNLISDKLQYIVNSSCVDISSLTVKAAENEFEKMHLDVNNLKSVGAASNPTTSDFINLPSNYEINNELTEQYHPVDIGNAQLLTTETFSNVAESSLNNINTISQLNSLNSTMNSCERNFVHTYVTIDGLSESNCDTFASVATRQKIVQSVFEESIKNNDCITKETIPNDTSQIYKSSDILELQNCSSNVNEDSLESSNSALTKDTKSDIEDCHKFSKLSVLKSKNYDKLNDKSDFKAESEESNKLDYNESSKDSIKSEEYDTSGTYQIEPVVSLVETSEVNDSKNELSTELNEKTSENCVSSKGLHFKRFKCFYCPAQFATKGNLNVHIRVHTGEKPYSCPICSSNFTTRGNLKRHIKTHSGEKPFECSDCGSKFTEKKTLTIHMRRHTGEKPYECKECGKRFAQSGILNTHMAMHLNQKAHLCEHCGKSFRQSSQLHIHKLRHENIRKHECTICSSRFLTRSDLERHSRRHTGERPFACSICKKKFTRQQSLNEHMNRHYGLRPYVCKYCSKAFFEMSACYKHEKQHPQRYVDPFEKTIGDDSQNSLAEFSTEPCVMHLQKNELSNPECNDASSKNEIIDSDNTTINTCIDHLAE